MIWDAVKLKNILKDICILLRPYLVIQWTENQDRYENDG